MPAVVVLDSLELLDENTQRFKVHAVIIINKTFLIYLIFR